MRFLYGYDHRGRLDRWLVVWSERQADMVRARWGRDGLTVTRFARN